MNTRPNIIICTCDQLRAFEVGCHGNTVVQTPSVDRLAAEGIRFASAVTNYPVCMAARWPGRQRSITTSSAIRIKCKIWQSKLIVALRLIIWTPGCENGMRKPPGWPRTETEGV
jgi:Sulfatase